MDNPSWRDSQCNSKWPQYTNSRWDNLSQCNMHSHSHIHKDNQSNMDQMDSLFSTHHKARSLLFRTKQHLLLDLPIFGQSTQSSALASIVERLE